MASLEKKTVRVPETGMPEILIIAVDNGWLVHAGRHQEPGSYSFDRAVAAFESFESLAAWLKTHIEDNSVKPAV